ncbi:hypothetical protein CIL05_17070 [Virgibacillus profundi]|uniref:2-hydroxyhepta-2,4-diene-1,7-dioate isomerase n=1 Tax=Virgibacillus profundi TaxID=2024555 RepID=A0A2A2IAI6_9BACI|nr:fumarylacetoacetate hydrolase family protein [Virgibacillus profundi]PAV28346.1 hypothetical protein CIL05_17070 [Virgibacillus profundi]PXY52292.1 DUF2437 domain-containing protein [Virgibacillus profundi]
MKIAYYSDGKTETYGVVKNNRVYPIKGNIFENFELADADKELEEITLLSPVQPRKLICVGLNYALHAKESKMAIPEEPLIFMCSPSAVTGHNESIILDNKKDPIDYEAELAIIIKKKAKNLDKDNYKEFVLGYTCANDVSNRYLQKKDGQFTRAKSFDTYKPVGPYIETNLDPDNLEIKLWQNGELKQDSNTDDMVFSVGDIIQFVSSIMTLEQGDVILTGTPGGIGNLKAGDRIDIELEGIGRLTNFVE